MARGAKNINGTEQVNEYMNVFVHPLKPEIEAVRSIILKADNKIAERVKWNAPSFYYKIDMAAFNHRAEKFAHLIFLFPKGKMIDSPLLEGDHTDRREIKFYDMTDIKAKKSMLEKLVKEWVVLVDACHPD